MHILYKTTVKIVVTFDENEPGMQANYFHLVQDDKVWLSFFFTNALGHSFKISAKRKL